MIVVTTPTGKIGSQLVKLLLAAKAPFRVIARDPAKLPPDVRNEVEVVEGSCDDEHVLSRAFDGADSLFWVVPPGFQSNNDNDYYLRFTRPACRAIVSRHVRRVVSVSGLGRGTRQNAGPIAASFAKDEEIERTGVHFRALWCPGFMENVLQQLQPIEHMGSFFLPCASDVKTPLVATRDIAASAAQLLLDTSWTGQGGRGVLGPEDLSYDDMAAIMSDVLKRTIRFQQIPAEAFTSQLMQLGASEAFARGLVDMYAAVDNGLYTSVQRTAENTTPTTFHQWCEEVLKPAIRS